MSFPLFYTDMVSPIGILRLFSTEKGICGIALHDKRFQGKMERLSRISEKSLQKNNRKFSKTIRQLECYFQGKGQAFRAELDLSGQTPFQLKVLQALMEIPYGTVKSYQWVAQRIKNPRAYRAVGSACGSNPIPIIIPCHRVIAKDGSLGGFSAGLDIKKQLLNIEKGK